MKLFLTLAIFISAICCNSQVSEKLSKKATEALSFCKKNKLNTEYCFLIDFSIHSGQNRFYIYDFKNGKILHSGLVCHGTGKNSTEREPVFSNESGSNCSSTGKYKTGKRAYSNWGINIHYKLHGFEKTNNNAFARNIVLHSYDYVPEKEIHPAHLTMGWSMGCPVIANSLMTTIDSMLKKSKKPALLWIYQ